MTSRPLHPQAPAERNFGGGLAFLLRLGYSSLMEPTTASPFVRATSVYTIRIERDQLSVEMQQIIELVAAALPNVVVSGVSSVSFTATNDAAALQIAQKATVSVAFWATFRLTTGRGVHRREVTHKSVRIAAAGQEA